MRTYLKIGKWLAEYLPTFCWQDYREILIFLEQIDDRVDPFSVKVTVGNLVKRGILVREKFPTEDEKHKTIYKYRRAEWPPNPNSKPT